MLATPAPGDEPATAALRPTRPAAWSTGSTGFSTIEPGSTLPCSGAGNRTLCTRQTRGPSAPRSGRRPLRSSACHPVDDQVRTRRTWPTLCHREQAGHPDLAFLEERRSRSGICVLHAALAQQHLPPVGQSPLVSKLSSPSSCPSSDSAGTTSGSPAAATSWSSNSASGNPHRTPHHRRPLFRSRSY